MDRRQLIEYVRSQRWGVVSTLGTDGRPQAAHLAIAATGRGELAFDAKPESRKIANLRRDPRIAVVVGGADGTTLQCEGIADFPEGDDLLRCVDAYLERFPEFAESIRSGTVVVVRVTPTWARYGDYRTESPILVEIPLGG
ncbi:pyridoxamine 5'-phosphate oxidase family protein [Agromyces bauzanensis]